MRARRVDHEVDYFLADATVLQIDDLGCRQVIHRLGIADVAEDDFVTETRVCQRLYISHHLSIDLGRCAGLVVAFEPLVAVEANLDPQLSVKADGQQPVAVDSPRLVPAMVKCRQPLAASCTPQRADSTRPADRNSSHRNNSRAKVRRRK